MGGDDIHDGGRDLETLIGELLLYYFEWMASNNVKDACAQGVHGLLSSILPPGSIFPAWATLKRLLVQVHSNNVQKVDMCPNDHIAFVDMTHPSLLHYKHAHRTKCPHPGCGAERYLTDTTGKTVTAKVGFYFPLDPFLLDMFKDPDMEEHLHHNMGEFPPGHTRRSRGFFEKVLNNPHINCESRNQSLIGMVDGIPLFRNKDSRGVVPIALRQANQPDSKSKKFQHIHLAGLFPCDFWVICKDTGLLKREKHKPANLGALLVLLTQDLLYWYEGKTAVDYNLIEGDPGRIFLLRAVLLFWCGDYPGLG